MNNEIRKKITSFAMAGAIASSGAAGNYSIDNDKFIQMEMEHQQREIEYIEYIKNEDLSYYKREFVEFYRNGIIVINGIQYSVEDLYLETGIKNNKEVTMLIYYKTPNNDIITGEPKDNFTRTSMIIFKNAYCFYEIFIKYSSFIQDNILIIDESKMNYMEQQVKGFDGTIHVETPETSYGKVKHK